MESTTAVSLPLVPRVANAPSRVSIAPANARSSTSDVAEAPGSAIRAPAALGPDQSIKAPSLAEAQRPLKVQLKVKGTQEIKAPRDREALTEDNSPLKMKGDLTALVEKVGVKEATTGEVETVLNRVAAKAEPAANEANEAEVDSAANPETKVAARAEPAANEANEAEIDSAANPETKVAAKAEPVANEANEAEIDSAAKPEPTVTAKAEPAVGAPNAELGSPRWNDDILEAERIWLNLYPQSNHWQAIQDRVQLSQTQAVQERMTASGELASQFLDSLKERKYFLEVCKHAMDQSAVMAGQHIAAELIDQVVQILAKQVCTEYMGEADSIILSLNKAIVEAIANPVEGNKRYVICSLMIWKIEKLIFTSPFAAFKSPFTFDGELSSVSASLSGGAFFLGSLHFRLHFQWPLRLC
jgi:hypothetical protein